MSETRDYDAEFKDNSDRKYAYDFDFDVMHGYMLKTFRSFYRPGSCLELGSFKGDFTKRGAITTSSSPMSSNISMIL